MDLNVIRILAVVGAIQSENLWHRMGKGFLAMQISQELVGPNRDHKGEMGKGKELIFFY